eukprot:CAMPEP_0113395546 /NCGR_PEP_ID=MMETSP0013_2-20120614/13258_1 /TAXON_ID=2843 ORGANISM="Skeletonema costatum, Strain 1716" /NCGR_SAMPLE_ID=MMETSP0013_2 /ASSEMBLY_ACC=CAM_ASM_000158 /LENGTH=224 /DNA_ID=CAMNT_0000279777 /DNA_START=420 /DNA_END=1091 /DNA_ORIENTATION=+ /assembly_acc=CAM_ASM_000158
MYSASRCLVLSNSRRRVTHHERTRTSTSKQTQRSYHASSSQSAKRNYRSCGVFAAASAGTSCAMCHSVRLTSACSTSSMLQYRGMQTTNINTPASVTAGANNRYSKSSPCFGNNGLGGRSAPLPTVVGPLVSCANQLSSSRINATRSANNVSSSQIGAFHSASKAMSSAPPAIGGGSQSSSAIQSLGSVEEIFASAGWASKAGAIIFAAAAAGSLFLSPIDRLR